MNSKYTYHNSFPTAAIVHERKWNVHVVLDTYSKCWNHVLCAGKFESNDLTCANPGFPDAPDEFVSEYSAPRIITQYQGLSGFQGLLPSTRDYPVSDGNCLSLALMIMPSIMNFQPKQRKWCRLKANWREFYDHSYFRDLTSIIIPYVKILYFDWLFLAP